MKKIFVLAPLFPALSFIVPAMADVPACVTQNGWGLVFSDDFNGTSLDESKWSRVNAGSSAWNKYASLDSDLVEFKDGCLVLKGKKDTATTGVRDFREAAINTAGKFSFQYGRVDIRAKFDSAQGVWPALWMMPNSNGAYGWPYNGEIDIMEHLNWEGSVYQTLHTYDTSKNYNDKSSGVHPDFAKYGGGVRDDWHVYSIEWTEEKIVFLLDDVVTGTFTSSITSNWPFDRDGNKFYLIFSMQIAGGWVESAGATGIDYSGIYNNGNGLGMAIDYVNVWSVIPEPSLFGLFAGTLALLFSGARRRRK